MVMSVILMILGRLRKVNPCRERKRNNQFQASQVVSWQLRYYETHHLPGWETTICNILHIYIVCISCIFMYYVFRVRLISMPSMAKKKVCSVRICSPHQIPALANSFSESSWLMAFREISSRGPGSAIPFHLWIRMEYLVNPSNIKEQSIKSWHKQSTLKFTNKEWYH